MEAGLSIAYYGGYGFGGYGLYFDPTMILVLIGLLLTMAASAYVNSTFRKYSNVRGRSGITGAQAAEKILRQAGITDVTIEHVSGELTDHYDPRTKTVKLSDRVYSSTSVAAISVAAHECGHVIQHHTQYVPLQIRTLLVPAANIGTSLAWPILILGILLGSVISAGAAGFLVNLGVLLFALGVLFQIVTLPVELNASSRALGVLSESGMLVSEEVQDARKVLRAAALTYVAGAAASILQLARIIILFGGRNRD